MCRPVQMHSQRRSGLLHWRCPPAICHCLPAICPFTAFVLLRRRCRSVLMHQRWPCLLPFATAICPYRPCANALAMLLRAFAPAMPACHLPLPACHWPFTALVLLHWRCRSVLTHQRWPCLLPFATAICLYRPCANALAMLLRAFAPVMPACHLPLPTCHLPLPACHLPFYRLCAFAPVMPLRANAPAMALPFAICHCICLYRPCANALAMPLHAFAPMMIACHLLSAISHCLPAIAIYRPRANTPAMPLRLMHQRWLCHLPLAAAFCR
ncbi:hypothetical protein EI94DRAFT_92923 [Lactarius quietus]|nr:hypothetical protein EI94DRAFT_92923 [Lactarius quietus]